MFSNVKYSNCERDWNKAWRLNSESEDILKCEVNYWDIGGPGRCSYCARGS